MNTAGASWIRWSRLSERMQKMESVRYIIVLLGKTERALLSYCSLSYTDIGGSSAI